MEQRPFNVKPFPMLCCNKVLPLVFDDALSYYEVLCSVKQKLNELISVLNEYQDSLKDYVDQQDAANLAKMQAQFDALQNNVNSRLDSVLDEMNTAMAQFRTEITNQIDENQAWVEQKIREMELEISQTVAEVYSRLNDTLTAAKAYTDFRIQGILDNLHTITNVYVLNPVTGQVTTIQAAIDDMYNALRYMGLTAFMYDSLQLTAQEYDDRQLYAWTYDRLAWYFFRGKAPWKWTFSGNTGREINLRQAIRELWADDRVNGITVQQFDDAEQTAQQFDNTGLTAYAFDWRDSTNGSQNPVVHYHQYVSLSTSIFQDGESGIYIFCDSNHLTATLTARLTGTAITGNMELASIPIPNLPEFNTTDKVFVGITTESIAFPVSLNCNAGNLTITAKAALTPTQDSYVTINFTLA